jgi:hypothetical protein
VLSRLRLLGVLAAAVSVVGAAPTAAQAGTYPVAVDTTVDVSGWQFFHDPGFLGCSIKSLPGSCAEIPSPTPLRIFGLGAADNLANAYWEWVAPPTTTIDHGSLTVSTRITGASTYAFMKARLRSSTRRPLTARSRGRFPPETRL